MKDGYMSENNNAASATEATTTNAGGAETTETALPIEQAAPPIEKRKYKYKVDGIDVEEDLSDDDVKKQLSLSKAAYKRMETAAKETQQAKQFIKMLRENPEEVLNNEQIMGSKKFRQVAEQYLAKQGHVPGLVEI